MLLAGRFEFTNLIAGAVGNHAMILGAPLPNLYYKDSPTVQPQGTSNT